jgi:hypothetical protein
MLARSLSRYLFTKASPKFCAPYQLTSPLVNNNPSLNFRDTFYVNTARFATARPRTTESSALNVETSSKKQPKEHTDVFWRVYIMMVKHVVDTCKVYLRTSPRERVSLDERSKFGYLKKEIDSMSAHKQEDMLEYLISITTLYGSSHNAQVTAFLKERHEGPNMLRIMQSFLSQDNPDLKDCLEKLNKRQQKELTGNMDMFKSYFKEIQEGKVRGL